MARMMTRRGPTHIGPYGLFQNLADTVKLMAKELITPKKADGFGFHFAADQFDNSQQIVDESLDELEI